MLVNGPVYLAREHTVQADDPPPPFAWRIVPDDSLNVFEERVLALGWAESLLVAQYGSLRLETYAVGRTAQTPANIKSVSKSLLAVLLGQIVDEGHLEGLDQFVEDFRPARCGSHASDQARVITLAHLLSMSAGYDYNESGDYRILASDDWICAAYAIPVTAQPGAQFRYGTNQSLMLAHVLETATGESVEDLFERELLRPMSIGLRGWAEAPEGTFFGGTQMRMTPRDLAAFGQLVLQQGHWNGTPLVSEGWMRRMLTPRFPAVWGDRGYALGWWVGELAGERYWLASGYGGQTLLILPGLQAVIVVTADTPLLRDVSGRHETLISLVETTLMPELTANRHPPH